MSETETDVVAEEAAPAEKTNCRHCGYHGPSEVPEDGDWLCAACDHYQDNMQCPTCGSQVRISLMPAEIHPEVHAPRRRKKES